MLIKVFTAVVFLKIYLKLSIQFITTFCFGNQKNYLGIREKFLNLMKNYLTNKGNT